MFLGIDIGTGSSKAVIADERGELIASASRPHTTASPYPGWFEHDAEATWWDDLVSLTRELLAQVPAEGIDAMCVSGIGPAVLVADTGGRPLRPAILYGIDTRAEAEIEQLTETLGEQAVLTRTGNILTTQAVGPKLLWVARHEPDVWERTRRWYSASNWLVGRLTGEYIIDHYTASASDPLYDLARRDWWGQGCERAAPGLELQRLVWPGEVVGEVQPDAAGHTGLAIGTPVVAGTIDAMAEAYSVGVRDVGDTMVMYGSTLFFIQAVANPASHPGLWAASGRTPETFSIAAGMATSGLITTWLTNLSGGELGRLAQEAAAVPCGSDGLVLLPYFAGERTPVFDARARGAWVGLTLHHTRAHLYRSVLEGVAMGARHNFEAMTEASATPRRLVAVGGGTRGNLWTRITSDVTGMPQDIPTTTIGAAYGDARMAADACAIDTGDWNPVGERIEPDPSTAAVYDELYGIYRRTYESLRDDMHRLSGLASGTGIAAGGAGAQTRRR
jgi:xylulokinase